MKIHKTPWTTQPIFSVVGKILHAPAVWVANHLQVISRHKASFISSPARFKEYLLQHTLPPNTVLSTADATAYCTNIPNIQNLREISAYIRRKIRLFAHLLIGAIISTLNIIIKNHAFTFGDMNWFQKSGTAMCTPPACEYATIFYAIHEDKFVQQFKELSIYKRYIDDMFGA